jgi:hypothetical protein
MYVVSPSPESASRFIARKWADPIGVVIVSSHAGISGFALIPFHTGFSREERSPNQRLMVTFAAAM